MKTKVLYKYLGTNGTILSPIHLEGIYCVKYLELTPEDGKVLTNDNKNFFHLKIVPETEEKEWKEIDGKI